MMLLSAGMSRIESHPELPSRHAMSFAQTIAFRGTGPEIVWPRFPTTDVLGSGLFSASLALFRRLLEQSQ